MEGTEDILKPDEVSRLLKVKTNTIYVWCKRGLLPYHQLGRCVRLRLKDVEKFINDHRVEGKR